jgi:methionyl-tRNA formyltransferase
VMEEQIGARALLAARARRLGWAAVAGQLAFRVAVMPLLMRLSRRRREAILEQAHADPTPPAQDRVIRVSSINGPAAVDALRGLEPRVVVVAGTRIISSAVLEAVPARFLNMHAGMTPRYRGVHGGYWALACRDPEHCGVTVHVVDSGVDTGDIVAQARIDPTSRDNFATYPYLQLVAGLPLLVEAVRSSLSGSLEPVSPTGPSGQWYHPTALGYLATWLRTGVH